jgi:hypothetical protein
LYGVCLGVAGAVIKGRICREPPFLSTRIRSSQLAMLDRHWRNSRCLFRLFQTRSDYAPAEAGRRCRRLPLPGPDFIDPQSDHFRADQPGQQCADNRISGCTTHASMRRLLIRRVTTTPSGDQLNAMDPPS